MNVKKFALLTSILGVVPVALTFSIFWNSLRAVPILWLLYSVNVAAVASCRFNRRQKLRLLWLTYFAVMVLVAVFFVGMALHAGGGGMGAAIIGIAAGIGFALAGLINAGFTVFLLETRRARLRFGMILGLVVLALYLFWSGL